MKRTAENAVLAELLGKTFRTADERAEFERHVRELADRVRAGDLPLDAAAADDAKRHGLV